MQTTNEHKVEYFFHLPQQIQTEGDYVNGELVSGIKYYTTGQMQYKGSFKNDMRNGNGELYHLNGCLNFKGVFQNDKPFNGYGFHKIQRLNSDKTQSHHSVRVASGQVISGESIQTIPMNRTYKRKEIGQVRFQQCNGLFKRQYLHNFKHPETIFDNVLYRNGKLIKQWPINIPLQQ